MVCARDLFGLPSILTIFASSAWAIEAAARRKAAVEAKRAVWGVPKVKNSSPAALRDLSTSKIYAPPATSDARLLLHCTINAMLRCRHVVDRCFGMVTWASRERKPNLKFEKYDVRETGQKSNVRDVCQPLEAAEAPMSAPEGPSGTSCATFAQALVPPTVDSVRPHADHTGSSGRTAPENNVADCPFALAIAAASQPFQSFTP